MEQTPDASVANQFHRSSSLASQRHVSYCCGSCGYDLNLSSSNRNTSTIGSKYGKSIRRGMISFFQIDESRFTQVDEFHCIPHFGLKNSSWGLFKKKTKLLCRRCGNHIGNARDDMTHHYALVPHGSATTTEGKPAKEETVSCRKFNIKIRALQPLAGDQGGIGTPLFS